MLSAGVTSAAFASRQFLPLLLAGIRILPDVHTKPLNCRAAPDTAKQSQPLPLPPPFPTLLIKPVTRAKKRGHFKRRAGTGNACAARASTPAGRPANKPVLNASLARACPWETVSQRQCVPPFSSVSSYARIRHRGESDTARTFVQSSARAAPQSSSI